MAKFRDGDGRSVQKLILGGHEGKSKNFSFVLISNRCLVQCLHSLNCLYPSIRFRARPVMSLSHANKFLHQPPFQTRSSSSVTGH